MVYVGLIDEWRGPVGSSQWRSVEGKAPEGARQVCEQQCAIGSGEKNLVDGRCRRRWVSGDVDELGAYTLVTVSKRLDDEWGSVQTSEIGRWTRN